jgi:hypothetical protein
MANSPDPVIQYFNIIGRYPGNNQQWWLARSQIDDSTRNLKVGDFMPETLQKLYMGNMHAPRGHYILDFFNKDRSLISSIPSLPVETINERPKSITFFSGRVWYGQGSNVLFSQVLLDPTQAANCYMDADPTSEEVSDLVATDGGYIPIPEASHIVKLAAYGGGVIVFAHNGVWAVTGGQNGFSALDYSVNKISPIGCQSPNSVVETDKAIFWWSDVGIMAASQSNLGLYGPISGSQATTDKLNITEQTIQSYYNKISDDAREDVKGVFDPKRNCIYWLYRENASSTNYDKVLIFDAALGAFYPWKFSASSNGVVKGIYIANRNNSYTIPTDIMPSQIEYIVSHGTSVRIAQSRSGQFVDWYSADNVGVTYDSYIETGYELFSDAMRKKNITYLFTYLTRTDSAIVSGQPDYPSSCNMQVKWEWSSSSGSNKWTIPTEVYRPGRLLMDTADTGFSMVVTKNKVRGNGKSIQFRYSSSEAGKNFDLVGWSIAASGSPIP